MKNTKIRDNAGRTIFENAKLCSQFLKSYSGIEILKDVKPEDIEDMTERFLPMFSEERNSDVVKRVKLPGKGDMFVIALIEHKSSVDYNVVMQMFHYMSYIWEEYEKTMEAKKKGIIKTKEFKYPPILPIVYYEDTATWTAAMDLRERVFLSDILQKYIPDYRYILFRLQDQENAGLIDRKDEISLIMLINKLRDISDFNRIDFPDGYFEDISERISGDVLVVLSRLIESFLREINLKEDKIFDLTDQIKEGNMARFYEKFHKFDIQEFERKALEIGIEKGEDILLIKLVKKKMGDGKTNDVIASEVEKDIETVNSIICTIESLDMEEFDADKVYEVWKKNEVAV